MTTSPATLPPAPAILRALLPWVIFLGLGTLGYRHVAHSLENDLYEFTILLITVLLGAVSVLLSSETVDSKAKRRWLWLLVPNASCLFLYASVIIAAAKLKQHPILDLAHQFGLSAVAFFVL